MVELGDAEFETEVQKKGDTCCFLIACILASPILPQPLGSRGHRQRKLFVRLPVSNLANGGRLLDMIWTVLRIAVGEAGEEFTVVRE
jgi:hypothetical protein